MDTFSELELRVGKERKTIYFGMPSAAEEMDAMFKLRHDVYKSRGYIDTDLLHNGLEKDNYDIEKKCYYFIAKIDKRIIGTARLINSNPLPIERECFTFETPNSIKKFSKDQRIELGRLIIVPYDNKRYIPRNLVLIFLIHCAVRLCEDRNFTVGYAFITKHLLEKLEKLKIPIYRISKYIQKYSKGGLLYRYFNQLRNPIVPVYFFRDEVKKYTNEVLNKKRMFQKVSEVKYILRPNLYNSFLRLMKVL